MFTTNHNTILGILAGYDDDACLQILPCQSLAECQWDAMVHWRRIIQHSLQLSYRFHCKQMVVEALFNRFKHPDISDHTEGITSYASFENEHCEAKRFLLSGIFWQIMKHVVYFYQFFVVMPTTTRVLNHEYQEYYLHRVCLKNPYLMASNFWQS